MQAATAISFTVRIPTKGARSLAPRSFVKFNRIVVSTRVAAVTPDPSVVSYDSPVSVFPMEACDLYGGEACEGRMFNETKLPVDLSRAKARPAQEEVDRDYVAYDEPKTVFPGEACDTLGGEFCEPAYQKGVAKELVLRRPM